jgi:hypothetical protein
LLSFKSAPMIGISGAVANQAKKQTKNAIQVRWKARICGVARLNKSMRVAFADTMAVIQEAAPALGRSCVRHFLTHIGVGTPRRAGCASKERHCSSVPIQARPVPQMGLA